MFFKKESKEHVGYAPREVMSDRIKELEAEVEKLTKRLKEFEVEINNEITASKPVIDFDIMRIFSIERMVNDNKPCTVIGYFLEEPVLSSDGEMIVKKDVVHQWYLYCNNLRHAELIVEYNAWKRKK